MTQQDKINTIPIRSQIDAFNTLYESLSSGDEGLVFIQLCERIQIVITFINKIIDGKNVELVSVQSVSDINTRIANINGHFTIYQSNKNIGYLDNANKECDLILSILPSITFPFRAIKEKSIDVGIDNIIKKTNDYNFIIQKNITDLEDRIMKYDIILQNLSSEIEKSNNVIENQKIRLDNAIQNIQSSFQLEQKERKTEFLELMTELKNNINEREASIEKENIALLESTKNKSEQLISYLEERKKQASDLLKIISNITVTGNYNKYAGMQRFNANILRAIAIGFMVILVAGAIWIIFTINPKDFDWKVTLIRLLATSILSVPAAYAARESSKHRKLEYKYRQMELELASLDPFMESLPDDNKITLKHEMVERMFGREDDSIKNDDKDDSVPASSLIDLIRDALKALGSK